MPAASKTSGGSSEDVGKHQDATGFTKTFTSRPTNTSVLYCIKF